MTDSKSVKPSDSLETPSAGTAATSNPRPRRWRTALLLASSALLGGMAVAVWNRRQIASIRKAQQEADSATGTDFGDEA